MLASVAGEVAIVAVDHRQAGAHEPGEVENGNAGPKGEGRISVAQVVGPTNRVDPGGELCWPPLAGAEVVQVNVAAARGWKQQ